ncbi:MAG TPA: hypothetical protein VE548_01650 [Nitrososphaeraceae archaeon]|jgi:hypothetical protein|nr:hypothetical protein [Nitrososphaeraceae archaeon]
MLSEKNRPLFKKLLAGVKKMNSIQKPAKVVLSLSVPLVAKIWISIPEISNI